MGAAFFAVFFAAFFADFFAVFLAAFFAYFFTPFFADFFEAFLADFFFAAHDLFLLSLFCLLLFFPLAIVILLLPPIHVHQALQVDRAARAGPF